MADPQPADTAPQQPTDIGALAGTKSGVFEDLSKLQREKLAEDVSITRKAETRLDKDQARMDAAFAAEGHSAAEQLKPWNADQQSQKYYTNPIEGFGSLGGIFAVVASAFTRAPMQNAIEGMAGAINAIRQGDDQMYERAHQAWKDNTKLALDRFRVQHDLYQDAMSLYDHDAHAADLKLRNAATRFGDAQTLMLLDHGMNKEVFDLQASRLKAAEQAQEFADLTTKRTFQKAAIQASLASVPKPGPDATPEQRAQYAMHAAALVQNVMSDHEPSTAEQAAIGETFRKNWNSPDLVDKLMDTHQQFSPKAPNYAGYYAAVDQWGQQHPGQQISPEEDAKLQEMFGLIGKKLSVRGAGAGMGSSQQIKGAAIQEIMDKHKAEGKPISIAEAEHEYNLTRAVPTGNQLDALQGKIDTAELAIDHSKKNLEFLRAYKGGAGLLGKIMRGEEIGENIAGISTQSDRVAFRRRVHELQEIIPRVLVDANGRPLKAEQEKANDVIAGLQAGDTGPNTIRAYEDLVKDLQYRVQKFKERQGKAAPTDMPAKTEGGDTSWLSAYPEKR